MFHSFKQFPRYVSSLLELFIFFPKDIEYLLEVDVLIYVRAGDRGLLSFLGRQSGGDPEEV